MYYDYACVFSVSLLPTITTHAKSKSHQLSITPPVLHDTYVLTFVRSTHSPMAHSGLPHSSSLHLHFTLYLFQRQRAHTRYFWWHGLVRSAYAWLCLWPLVWAMRTYSEYLSSMPHVVPTKPAFS